MDKSGSVAALRLTPTMEFVENELGGRKTIYAWDIVRSILNRHPEYGRRSAREIANSTGPSSDIRQTFNQWLKQVQSLFDPAMVPYLHGRLVILGLCQFDKNLFAFLNSLEFITSLEDELREDFYSLLQPEYTVEAESYRKIFIQVLQNRAKFQDELGDKRTKGFLFAVDGGPGLDILARLSQRQDRNTCLTARYIISADSTLQGSLISFSKDLSGLAIGDENTFGIFVPEPASERRIWSHVLNSKLTQGLERMTNRKSGLTSEFILKTILPILADEAVLKSGFRLLLFFEFKGQLHEKSSDKLGLNPAVLGFLQELPERLGVIFSGISPEIQEELKAIGAIGITLPRDRQLKSGQPLVNDMAAGPDRLNLVPEVHALAEAIALKEMTPPIVLGILGGWGAGKSFVMHLLEERIMEIRCEHIPESSDDNSFPFIGHPYLIRFDAWTYAKSSIWASLMQRIFIELDRQISLEQVLANKLNLSPLENTEIWRLLSEIDSTARERLTNTRLGREAIEAVARFETGQSTTTKLWQVFSSLKDKEKQLLETDETILLTERQKLEDAKSKLAHHFDDQIKQKANRAAWVTIADKLLRQAADKWSKENNEPGAENKWPDFDQAKSTIVWYKQLWQGRNSISIMFILFAAVVLFGALMFNKLDTLFPQAASVFGLLSGLYTWLRKTKEWIENNRNIFNESVTSHFGQDDKTRDSMIKQAVLSARRVDADDSELMTDARAVADSQEKVEHLEDQIDTRRHRIGMTARHKGLLEFVQERIEGRYYEDKLGLMHQVKSDLEELTQALMDDEVKASLFPRGLPRIILLIDDLDRCPPARVIEVLEAAQLLVKTKLFVVVVALDVRYITRALEKYYDGVLVRGGEPSGLDYIEKIIQIPYRIRPVAPSAVESFLHAQMALEDTKKTTEQQGDEIDENITAVEPDEIAQEEGQRSEQARIAPIQSTRTELRVLPTENVKFRPEELKLITACCAAIEVNPRAMKRLVNIYKLLKIIWYRKGLDKGPNEDIHQAMLALLVLGARYPEVMRVTLYFMETIYTRQVANLDEKIAATIATKCRSTATQYLFPKDWEAVADIMTVQDFFPQEMTFRELHEENLHLVSTFSFVSETDPEREATLLRRNEQRPSRNNKTTAAQKATAKK